MSSIFNIVRMLIPLFLAGIVFAQDCRVENFFRDRERGWFWRNVCLEEEAKKKKKEKEEKMVVVIPWDRLGEMKPSEVRKIYEKALDVAVANPTYENVRELKRLEVWMLKKASKFQEVATLVAMTDPEVASFAGMIASTTPGRMAYMKERSEEIYGKVLSYRDRAGLLIAVREGCSYCRALKEMIATYFVPGTGWSVRYVDIDRNPAFAENMQVYAVPDVFLAVKGEKPFVLRIATGYVSYDTLLERIYVGLKIYEQGGLSHAEEVSSY